MCGKKSRGNTRGEDMATCRKTLGSFETSTGGRDNKGYARMSLSLRSRSTEIFLDFIFKKIIFLFLILINLNSSTLIY